MNPSDVRYKDLIEEYSNDPEFLAFDDATQDSILDIAMQKKFGSVPNSEGLLSKVANDIGAVASTVTFPFPQMARELSKSPIGGPMEYGMRASQGTLPEPEFDIPEPKTEVGKMANTAANIIPLAIGGYGLARGGIKAGKALLNPFRAGPVKEGIKDLLKQGKSVAYSGSKEIKDVKIPAMFDEARNFYTQMLEKYGNNISPEDFMKVADDIIESKGISGKQFLDPAEEALVGFKKNMSSKLPKETISPILNSSGKNIVHAPESAEMIKDASELKTIKNDLYGRLKGRPDLEGEFYNKFGEMLNEKGFSEFLESGKKYSNTYKTAKEAKKITRGSLGRVSRGVAPEEEVADLMMAEKPIKTSKVKEASDIGKKVVSMKELLGKKEANLKRLKFWSGATGIGVGISNLLDYMKNQR